ncbi:hypothetical protein Tco_1440153 [Tanacetum coccineum]
MNQNQIGRTVFVFDEETDAFYLQKASEYHEWLIQQEAQPRLTRTPIFRDREDVERRLRADYFDDHYNYTANPLPQHFHFFTSRLDCTGRMSISALMKCTTAIRQMAYGSTPDAFDEYLQMRSRAAEEVKEEVKVELQGGCYFDRIHLTSSCRLSLLSTQILVQVDFHPDVNLICLLIDEAWSDKSRQLESMTKFESIYNHTTHHGRWFVAMVCRVRDLWRWWVGSVEEAVLGSDGGGEAWLWRQ